MTLYTFAPKWFTRLLRVPPKFRAVEPLFADLGLAGVQQSARNLAILDKNPKHIPISPAFAKTNLERRKKILANKWQKQQETKRKIYHSESLLQSVDLTTYLTLLLSYTGNYYAELHGRSHAFRRFKAIMILIVKTCPSIQKNPPIWTCLDRDPTCLDRGPTPLPQEHLHHQ
jgi:hypothetical protein